MKIAHSWVESFDILLDAYRQIGEHIPLLQQYRSLFEQNQHMGLILEMVYKDILEFHRCALSVFRRSSEYSCREKEVADTSDVTLYYTDPE